MTPIPPVTLRSLLGTKLYHAYLTHAQHGNDPATIDLLVGDTLTPAGREAWADVLDAPIVRIQPHHFGVELQLAGVTCARIDAFTHMLNALAFPQNRGGWVREPDEYG